jgi:hypothetical protein
MGIYHNIYYATNGIVELIDYPPGQQRIFLQKQLTRE